MEYSGRRIKWKISCQVMSATTFNKTSLGPQHKRLMGFLLCNNVYFHFDGSKKVFTLCQLLTESIYSFVSTCDLLRNHDIEFPEIH